MRAISGSSSMLASASEREAGQSTIEFILTVMMFLGFSFLFLQITFVFAIGNYAHYATFMAARAYLSSGPTPEDQKERAANVIGVTLKKGSASAPDRWTFVAKSEGDGEIPGATIGVYEGKFNPNDKRFSWLEGVRYRFRSKLFVLPFAGGGTPKTPDINSLVLQSESWLGREPAFVDCASYMSRAGSRGQGASFDNGC